LEKAFDGVPKDILQKSLKKKRVKISYIRDKDEDLFYLEKAFDRVPKYILQKSLKKKMVKISYIRDKDKDLFY